MTQISRLPGDFRANKHYFGHHLHYLINAYKTGGTNADSCIKNIYARLAVDFNLPVQDVISAIEKNSREKEQN